MKKRNLTLVQSEIAYSFPERKVQDVYKCFCGKLKVMGRYDVNNGRSKSCGCSIYKMIEGNKTHGMRYTSEYNTYRSMLKRCLNKKHSGYKNYGAKGVKICKRWLNSFENFYADMGPKPTPKHSIDRKNPHGDYKPSNCRWATPKEQANNKRKRAA